MEVTEPTKMKTTFDDILEEAGSYGWYQKWRIWIIIFPVVFLAGMQGNVVVFQTVIPTYWCHVPGRELTNYTLEQWKNLTLPPSQDDPGSFEKCLQYNVTLHEEQVVVDHTLISCQSGWDHDTSSFRHTVATYYGWLCDKESYINGIFTVNALGNAVGTMGCPIVAERWAGRRIMFYVAVSFGVVFNLFSLVTPNYFVHLICRFFAGFTFEGNWNMPYTIMMELIKPEKRSILCFLLFISWSLAMMFIPLLAWAIPHWVHLAALINITGLYFFLFCRVFPESPRWMLSWGKYEEAAATIQQVARSNGKEVPATEDLVHKLKNIKSDEKDAVSFLHIIRYRRIIMYLCVTAIQAFCYYLIYGITLLNFDILPNRNFLGFFISSAIQAPSGFIGWLGAHYLGRRASGFGLALLLVLFCLIGTLSPDKVVQFSIIAIMKCFTNAAIYILFLYLAEVFPTPIRATAFGSAIVLGFLGYALSPYVNAVDTSIQFWVMLALSSVSLLCSIPLPETVGYPLPQTYEEAVDIVRYRPLTSWVHHWNYTRYLPEAADQNAKKETQNEEKNVKDDGAGSGPSTANST